MTRIVAVTDPAAIERFARRDVALHFYELGDLDPAFFPRTRWWGLKEGDGLSALALLYDGGDPPTLIALARDDGGAAGELLAAIATELPDRLYAHLSPGLVERLSKRYVCQPKGRHSKMVLSAMPEVSDDDVVRLGEADLALLRSLYASAYPGNWFDSRMLATGQYHGVWEGDALVAVAGVHVFSPAYGVAALGNVTTAPSHRGRGLAGRATRAVCRSLAASGITTVGLNVRADNAAAIRCYERLGFEIVAEYDEAGLTRSA